MGISTRIRECVNVWSGTHRVQAEDIPSYQYHVALALPPGSAAGATIQEFAYTLLPVFYQPAFDASRSGLLHSFN